VKRVCHLISGDLWAGAEVMASHLLKGLQRSGQIELTCILLNESRLAHELRKTGLNVLVLDESKLSFFQISQRIRHALSTSHPNILHAHRLKENLLAFIASKIFREMRLVSTQHGLPENHGSHLLSAKIKQKANEWVLAKKYDLLVSVSDDIRKFYTKVPGMNAEKVTVIHNGIEIPSVVSKRVSDTPFLAGSSGRLFQVKDYQLMVRIAMDLGLEGISFSLAGEGPERMKLEKFISDNHLTGKFELKGHVDDMSSFYSGIDLYLNTSIHEGIPVSILEAMAWGLPVVAPRVGGIPEIITDGEEGFLIDGREPRDFAEKIRLLCQDVELRRLMGAKARARVEQCFSVHAMTEGYLKIYHELLESTSR
jgi:L-malate glycosyltransferase